MPSANRLWKSSLAGLLLAVPAPGSVPAQVLADEFRDSDAAVWWPLVPTIDADDLRRSLSSPEESKKRYTAAVEAGLARRLSERQLRSLVYYVNGELTPELTPA